MGVSRSVSYVTRHFKEVLDAFQRGLTGVLGVLVLKRYTRRFQDIQGVLMTHQRFLCDFESVSEDFRGVLASSKRIEERFRTVTGVARQFQESLRKFQGYMGVCGGFHESLRWYTGSMRTFQAWVRISAQTG